jgi:hypothetical protein
MLAMAYAVERAGVSEAFVDLLIHAPTEPGSDCAARCLLAIFLSQAEDFGGAIAVLEQTLGGPPAPSPEMEALARLVLAHSLRARGDPEEEATESRLARELAERSPRADLLKELQAELETATSILPRDRPGDG